MNHDDTVGRLLDSFINNYYDKGSLFVVLSKQLEITMSETRFRKYLWMELIGFDNRQEDYGVAEFLSRMPVRPEVISILIWNTDLIHSHHGLAEDGPIGLKHCAYHARPRNEEHDIQNWTRFQLRGLIQELHHHGVKVFVSFFDQLMSKETQRQRGLPDTDEWIDHHQEVRYVDFLGRQTSLCIWKRLSDGTLYEYFFVRQLEAFMRDYGFDGLHGADGFGHPRESIFYADFSDDMVGQFMADTKVSCPTELALPERAKWILENKRKEWTDFHARRHAQFWRKTIAMLNRNGWDHAINSCWTRDPLEARIRYGVDVKLMVEAGVRRWICEANAAALELEGWDYTNIPKADDYRATVQRLKACCPECEVLLLHCVKDGLEQYNVLHHAPTLMQTDVLSLANVLYDDKRALDGVTVCLADGIRKAEWEMFDELYSKAFVAQPSKLYYPRIVWSDNACRCETDAYRYGHVALNSHALHAALLSHGAVLPAIVRLDDLPSNGEGPLVVLHPAFFSADELKKIHAAADGNVVEIGLDGDDEAFGFKFFTNGICGKNFCSPLENTYSPKNPYTWLDDLPERWPEKAFLTEAATAINEAFSIMRAETDVENIRLWGYGASDGLFHLFASNRKHTYSWAKILLKKHADFVQLLSGGFVIPPTMEETADGGTRLQFKLPPMGTVCMTLRIE